MLIPFQLNYTAPQATRRRIFSFKENTTCVGKPTKQLKHARIIPEETTIAALNNQNSAEQDNQPSEETRDP